MDQAWRDFTARIGHPDYPCYFGTHAFEADAIRYGVIGQGHMDDLPFILSRFLDSGREHPLANLAVFFEPNRAKTHDQAEAHFWAALQTLQDADPDASHRMDDPDHPLWEFTFEKVQMFVVGMSPTYKRRRSRNFGASMVLLFQPRNVFDVVIKGREAGDAARDRIRARLAAWDEAPPSPLLGVYGDPKNREWRQYFLPDDEKPQSNRCPLSFHGSRTPAADETAIGVTHSKAAGAVR